MDTNSSAIQVYVPGYTAPGSSKGKPVSHCSHRQDRAKTPEFDPSPFKPYLDRPPGHLTPMPTTANFCAGIASAEVAADSSTIETSNRRTLFSAHLSSHPRLSSCSQSRSRSHSVI